MCPRALCVLTLPLQAWHMANCSFIELNTESPRAGRLVLPSWWRTRPGAPWVTAAASQFTRTYVVFPMRPQGCMSARWTQDRGVGDGADGGRFPGEEGSSGAWLGRKGHQAPMGRSAVLSLKPVSAGR